MTTAWKIIKNSEKNNTSKNIETIRDNGKITNPYFIANEFNNFFKDEVNNLVGRNKNPNDKILMCNKNFKILFLYPIIENETKRIIIKSCKKIFWQL